MPVFQSLSSIKFKLLKLYKLLSFFLNQTRKFGKLKITFNVNFSLTITIFTYGCLYVKINYGYKKVKIYFKNLSNLPECIFEWTTRLFLVLADHPQVPQVKGRSLVCLVLWTVKSCFRLKDWPHSSPEGKNYYGHRK